MCLCASKAPCTPQVVTSHLDCQAGGLNVSWQVSVGAVGYCARVEGTGEPMMCESGDGTSTTCYIPHLPCGHSYNLTVVALGDTCNSSRSAAQEVMAGKGAVPQSDGGLIMQYPVLAFHWYFNIY